MRELYIQEYNHVSSSVISDKMECFYNELVSNIIYIVVDKLLIHSQTFIFPFLCQVISTQNLYYILAYVGLEINVLFKRANFL